MLIVTQQMPKHFQTSAQNVTCDEREETNRNSNKNRNNRKIRKFFFNFCDAIMDVDFFVFQCDIFEKQACNICGVSTIPGSYSLGRICAKNQNGVN